MPDSIIKTDNMANLAGDTAPRIPDGSPVKPSLAFTNDPNTGLYRISEDKVGVSAGGRRVGEFGNNYGGFTGNVIQVRYTEITSSGATGALTPFNINTAPNNLMGFELLTLSITPLYLNSRLLIESNVFIGEESNHSNAMFTAIFRDSGTVALSTGFTYADQGSSPFGASIQFFPVFQSFQDIPNSILPITYRLRMGADGSGALRWNGNNGAQRLGGTLRSYLKIMEIQQ